MHSVPPQAAGPRKIAPTSAAAVARVSRPVLFRATLLILLTPIALAAQSIQTISPQQCVWHAGDNVTWAASDLDESGWQPYSAWNPTSLEPRIWIRCHADLASLRSTSRPALQVALDAAYAVYVDGRPIGSAGNLQSGAFSLNVIRDWPLSSDLAPDAVIALRVTRKIAFLIPVGEVPPLEMYAGAANLLQDRRSGVILSQVRPQLIPVVCFIIVGVLGAVLIPLWMSDRNRRELLLLTIACIFVPVIYLDRLGPAALVPYSMATGVFAYAASAFVVNPARELFFFALARRRVPLVFWIFIILGSGLYIPEIIGFFLPPHLSLWLNALDSHQFEAWGDFFRILENLSPFAAFLPWSRLTSRMKPLAVLSMAWGTVMIILFAVRLTSHNIPGIPDLQTKWSNSVSDAEAVITLSLVLALLFLLFREQQQTARERAVLAGEMASAREIQQYLIPHNLPPTPGLNIRSVYQPSREVGGDFFQILPDLRDGSTLIVIGDVAGKGLKAGMLATLIVGAIRVAFKFTSDPERILALLNERLQGRGLVTCLAVRIDRDGNAELANAGHLPPYIDGQELALDGALPLGAVPEITFPIVRLRLDEGQSMLFVSDGIIEAQSQSGELFGFDRTRELSTRSAEAIVQAAQEFGQQDDITVLTVTFAPAEVLHA